ncbi:MAG TPA: histidine phosphatase family protein [Gaiellaceae bacterium]
MRTLYLLRHAKSSWDHPALSDHERPLTPRGRRAARRIADHLVQLGIEPELVLCSTAVRTRSTLELVRPALGGNSTVTLDDALYAASSGELLDRIRRVRDEVASVMLIAHNPGLQRLALVLASSGEELPRLEDKFPTAALATLAVPETTWSRLDPGGAFLTAYVVPKELG